MSKKNCWDQKKCGREPLGAKTDELGVCPAATETSLDGIHGGKNAGRACWVIEGSMCGGRIQGTFAQKYANCTQCDFYQTIRQEEGLNMEMSIVLVNILRKSMKAAV